MSRTQRILVAGVGNIFLGDDAFGVEVALRLNARPQPKEVQVVDFGIRGLDLTYALLEGYDAVILVDAAPQGQPPGTLYVMEIPTGDGAGGSGKQPDGGVIQTHALHPAAVLEAVRAMGGRIGRLLLVACEPTPMDAEDMCMEFSPAVQARLDEAVGLVESVVVRVLANDRQLVAAGPAEIVEMGKE